MEDDDWEEIPDNEIVKTPARDDQAAGRPLFEFSLKISIGGNRHSTASTLGRQLPLLERDTSGDKHSQRLEQEQSRLFRLPVEVRLRIYEMVLYVPADRLGVRLVHRSHSDVPTVLSLLGTCRKVLGEAEEIFYLINRIRVTRACHLVSLNIRRREAIRMMSLPAEHGSTTLQLVSHLHHVPQLRSLYLQRYMSIRFIDIKAWAVMSYQIATEVKKHEHLEEVLFIMPDVKDITEFELQRQHKLDEVDMRVARAAVRFKESTLASAAYPHE